MDLADFVHFVTRLKLVPEAADDPSASPEERVRGKIFAKTLSMAVLTRAWQLLLKGLQEVKDSPRPLAAADMVLVRLAYAADLPPPDEVLRRLSSAPTGAPAAPRGGGGGGGGGARAALAVVPRGEPMARPAPEPRPVVAVAASPAPAPVPAVRLERLEDVVALAAAKRDIALKTALETDVHLVRFDEGSIEFFLAPDASPALPQQLMRKLGEWTGQRWVVALSRDPGAPSLRQQALAREKEKRSGIEADPLVASVLAAFPGATIVKVRPPGLEPEALPDPGVALAAEPVDDGGEDIAFEDMIFTEDDL